MHKEAGRITLAVEMYIFVLALIFGVLIYILFNVIRLPMALKWGIAGLLTLLILLGACIFAPLFGRSVRHSLDGNILHVSYGVLLKYIVNVDFRRFVYITKIRGPFERMSGVVVLAFYFSGGCVFVPVGDNTKAERYIRKWTQRIR